MDGKALPRMKVGVYLLATELDPFLEAAQEADRLDYQRVWVPDSQMLWRDVYLYMARGLQATSRISFGTGVTNPVTRHHTVTANAHATLAAMFPGRVILGIGRGDSSVRTLGLEPMPTSRFREVVRELRDLVRGDGVEMNRVEARIVWAEQKVPLMMSAIGPRNLELAGAVADIVQPQVGVHPNSVEWAIDHVRAGAEAAGRDPDDVEISIYCVMHVADDLCEAYDAARFAPSSAATSVAAVVRNNTNHGMPVQLVRSIASLGPSGEHDYYGGHLQADPDHDRYVSDEMVDDFALVGPPERCIERIRALAALGVSEVAVLFGGPTQIARVGTEIVPHLAALTE